MCGKMVPCLSTQYTYIYYKKEKMKRDVGMVCQKVNRQERIKVMVNIQSLIHPNIFSPKSKACSLWKYGRTLVQYPPILSSHSSNNIYTYIQCSKAREVNFQFWELFAVVLDTHIKCVHKVHRRIDPTLLMLPLN